MEGGEAKWKCLTEKVLTSIVHQKFERVVAAYNGHSIFQSGAVGLKLEA